MNISKESFQNFLHEYCKIELDHHSLKFKKTESLEGITYITSGYKTSTGEILELNDIIPRHVAEPAPIYIVNIQDELIEGSLDDLLIQNLLEKGFRVIFTKHSFYKNKNLDEEFIKHGLSFWKNNIVSQLICIQYLQEQASLCDINAIGINGLSGCLLAALFYYEISCNKIHLINGLLDFNQIADNGEWNIFFTNGFYDGMDCDSIHKNFELQYLNPSMLLKKISAREKLYYSGQSEKNMPDMIVHAYHNRNELFKQLIGCV